MKFKVDHDLHIHSSLSFCSNDPAQSPEAILHYAQQNHFHTICLTDHFWDSSIPGASNWYQGQNFAHIQSNQPLPQSPKCRFLFGCETEMDRFKTIAIHPSNIPLFDFIIVPTTHLHMFGFTISEEDASSFERRAAVIADHFSALLNANLPFSKVGVAHLTCELISGSHTIPENSLQIIDLISDDTWATHFSRSASLGLGIELNFSPANYSPEQLPRLYRPYRIAKECGCKFYLGSDAHHPDALQDAPARFSSIINDLNLSESDKIPLLLS